MSVPLDFLFEAAVAVRTKAYAPYSGFQVGAALRAETGEIFVGANVENSAYPVGTCAEAGAIAAMVAAGARRIEDILVVADCNPLITPCGACRQRLAEFGASTTRVHTADLTGVHNSYNLSDLLPLAFALRPSGADNRRRENGGGENG
jgi:cytidine deaminase